MSKCVRNIFPIPLGATGTIVHSTKSKLMDLDDLSDSFDLLSLGTDYRIHRRLLSHLICSKECGRVTGVPQVAKDLDAV